MEKFYVISCQVLWRELCHFASLSGNTFIFNFLKQGLHETPNILRKELQSAIDGADKECSAILLGYGLCSNSLEGIVARDTKLVILRAHDCITFLLGSKERYREYFDGHPGTYWYSPGWIEAGANPGKESYEKKMQAYIEKYGKEDAEYLMQTEREWHKKYTQAAYVDLGFGDNDRYKTHTKACAEWLGWKYDELAGDARLMTNFLEGHWNTEDFLIVNPGETVAASHDEKILKARKMSE